MAYIDQRTGGNRRVAAMTIVALIQGAAVVALINGFTVNWRATPPPPRTEGQQIKLEPIPTPPPPKPQPPTDQIIRPDPLPPVPLPPIGGPIADPIPTPVPDPVPTHYADPLPQPSQKPLFTPRGARPRNAPGTWATSSDYPARDLREGNQGSVGFQLAVGADGKVQSCAIVRSSGFAGLDKATCDNVSRRARFDAATDDTGARVAGTYSGTITWLIPRD